MNQDRIESLDSLRGIAAMIVVIFHCLLSFNIFFKANYEFIMDNFLIELLTVTPLHTVWAGKEAVLLFFVLSGFVLMISTTTSNQQTYSSYLIKRICRIYLPYIVVMIISTGLTFLFWQYNNLEGLSPTYENRWDHQVSLQAIIAYIAMINYDTANVNGVVWTLFIEMKISLILPVFLCLISRFEWKKGLLLSLGLNTILVIIVEYGLGKTSFLPIRALFLFFNGTFEYNYYFILGAILAKQRHVFKGYNSMRIPFKYIILGVSLLFINSRWIGYITGFESEYIENFIVFIGFVLLFFVILSTKVINDFLNKKILRYLGKISFSLYLVHIPVLMLTTVSLSSYIPIWLAFCLVPVFSIPVAHLSYKWIEETSMKLGRNLAKKINKKDLKTKVA